MPTVVIGDDSFARSSKWKRTRASPAWAKWAAAGNRPRRRFCALKSYLVGHDPARLEEMRFRISNPTASLYNNRTQMAAALEFACLDILGQKWGVPVYDILGGKLQDTRALRLVFVLQLPKSKNRLRRSAHAGAIGGRARRASKSAAASPPIN